MDRKVYFAATFLLLGVGLSEDQTVEARLLNEDNASLSDFTVEKSSQSNSDTVIETQVILRVDEGYSPDTELEAMELTIDGKPVLYELTHSEITDSK